MFPMSRPDEGERNRAGRLFEALKSGDRAAMQELLPPLRERLLRLAEKRLRGDYPEEVVQETLKTLWEKRNAVSSAAHLLPFVFQTLRNKIGNVFYRACRDREGAGSERGPEAVASDRCGVSFGSTAGSSRSLEKFLRQVFDFIF